jgi:hypothetical protein
MAELVKERMQPSWEEGLLDYVIRLAKVNRRKIKFVILDGSAAEKKDKKGSDYDVVVVKAGRDERWNRPIELCGVQRRRANEGSRISSGEKNGKMGEWSDASTCTNKSGLQS